MLTIRTEQMHAFYAEKLRTAKNRIRQRVLDDARSRVAGGDIDTALNSAIQRAQSLGLASESELWLYIDACLDFGWDFEQLPQNTWISHVFSDPRIPSPPGRIRHVHRRLLEIRRIEQHNARARSNFAHGNP